MPAASSPLNASVRVLIVLVSVVTIGFGLWHFTVPSVWSWYAAINNAELVLAVRAINVLFSLLMVLHGSVILALTFRTPTEVFALRLMLVSSSVLWGSRVVLQLVFPQGKEIGIANIMLVIFVATWLFVLSALGMLFRKRPGG